jgi:hypothetical protein
LADPRTALAVPDLDLVLAEVSGPDRVRRLVSDHAEARLNGPRPAAELVEAGSDSCRWRLFFRNNGQLDATGLLQRASFGCLPANSVTLKRLRVTDSAMRNGDILRLRRLMPVGSL